jgi:post-segregation antitoxin (ccd killing protein)
MVLKKMVSEPTKAVCTHIPYSLYIQLKERDVNMSAIMRHALEKEISEIGVLINDG